MHTSLIERLRAELPVTFSRKQISKLLGGIIAPGTVANFDSKGQGPAGLFFLGKSACYSRDEFLEWLEPRLMARHPKNPSRARHQKVEA